MDLIFLNESLSGLVFWNGISNVELKETGVHVSDVIYQQRLQWQSILTAATMFLALSILLEQSIKGLCISDLLATMLMVGVAKEIVGPKSSWFQDHVLLDPCISVAIAADISCYKVCFGW